VELLKAARERQRDVQFILMTAYGTVESAVEAMKSGAYDYLSKPLDMQRLRAVVLKALEFQALVAENQELRHRLQKGSEPSLLLGRSEAIEKVRRLIDEVARTDVTVLLDGESGTGKELAARLIHERSHRARQPFVPVNCAALPESLIEAELFGHVRGAFTGAVADRPGRFQLADRGTLFLDEIGDLPPKGQADLLRVLEDGAFRKVGSSELVQVNVRVVAATNKNLRFAVEAGTFREDLFYRLQVIPIHIPPLRERTEDLPLLIEVFLDHFSARHKRRRKRLDAEALRLCRRYPWTGNVRQLRNLMERLVITCPKTTIAVEDLPPELQEQDRTTTTFTLRPGMTLAEAEKLLIRQTLAHVTENREEAARILGISRRTLQYKLRAYGLLQDPKRGR
jgi:DNA-binding NtrC family response regulator